MSDRFHPLTMEQLTGWVFDELEGSGSIFGIPRELFFTPTAEDRYRLSVYGQPLETPFGAAAGPHTQMAQNLIAAWLVGGRFLELKTVQTLDELDVNKPCIDAQDEGYNVEWSQELKVYESFDEYLRAWVLIHALHHALGLPGERPGMIFNMSVGYNLEGIRRPNVQWYLGAMGDASAYLPGYLGLVAARYPGIRDVDVPARLSDNVTLSTMHGCPPDEIEQITAYLMSERGLHTSVKCNPTLLGADGVRSILHDDLGFTDVPVPDQAFEHDLRWEDAVPMFDRLRALAAGEGVTFGLKLSNTLEVENWRTRFPGDETMYLSGRPLHVVTTNLALKVAERYEGEMLLSFAGGADCFNVPDLLRSGLTTVTVCSDLLKSGGYLRMTQYFEELDAAMDRAGASDLDDFTVRTSPAGGTVAAAGLANLREYAATVRGDRRFVKSTFDTSRSKTTRGLGLFDCIEAPCVDECPVDQAVPLYMDAVRTGDYATAVAITRGDNPMPSILGHVCDHLCEHTCVRTHYDEPLAIREIKRFIMSREEAPAPDPTGTNGRPPVAVIGAGPCGLAAAERLAAAGHPVTVFEQYPYAGGMVGGAIPAYRLPQAVIDQDLAPLERLGVDFRFGQTAGVDFTLEGLRDDGYEDVVVAVGAQLAKRLGLDGEEAAGVLDGIAFLRSVREGNPVEIGSQVAVIGAGDTAMDCARSAARLGADVTVVYRRTIDQMPADREEVQALLDEGVHVEELSLPVGLIVEDGALAGLECLRMEFRGDRDAGGRKIPHAVEGSEHVLPFDTMLLAISQHSVLDFFGDDVPELSSRGYLATDPVTLETSAPGIYAGGDVGGHGPASIVKAAADGKAIAAAISGRHAPPPEPHRPPEDRVGLLSRRSHREWRVPVPHVPVAEREGFEPVVLTYSEEEARREAERCLDCHAICSICVGVCPNLAILTYESDPVAFDLPVVSLDGGGVAGTEAYEVGQALQVAVLTDFCNECGNCETFCPTAGAPYRDKPRLYLDRADFEAQDDNAFMLFRGGVPAIEGRFGGETHRVEMNGSVVYRSPRAEVEIDPDGWRVLGATGDDSGEVSLRPAADLWVLLRGLIDSVPFLPGHDESGTRVTHPGYAE